MIHEYTDPALPFIAELRACLADAALEKTHAACTRRSAHGVRSTGKKGDGADPAAGGGTEFDPPRFPEIRGKAGHPDAEAGGAPRHFPGDRAV